MIANTKTFSDILNQLIRLSATWWPVFFLCRKHPPPGGKHTVAGKEAGSVSDNHQRAGIMNNHPSGG